MATGRMLKKQISLSEAVNDLSIKAALLFTWCIPHADDFGRMPGSPRRIKAEVLPLRDDFSHDDVTGCLEELQYAGLICWYEAGGERFVAFPTWEDHQSGLHKRTKSRFPPPPGISGTPPIRAPEVPGSSGKFHTNGTEQNGTEGNGTERIPDIASTIQEEDAPADEAAERWKQAAAVAGRGKPPGYMDALERCRPLRIEADAVVVALPDQQTDRKRIEDLMQALRNALRMNTDRPLHLAMVDPNIEARAGPEVSDDAAEAAGP